MAQDILPPDVLETWSVARGARLFEDVDFGQWGLKILSPADSAARTTAERVARPDEYKQDDIVLGEFLGDQDLLVVEGSSGAVLVAMPLDSRRDWWPAASGVGEFLERYVAAEGSKYWEHQS